MSENGSHNDPNAAMEGGPAPRAKLTILWTATGDVFVDFPQDAVVAMGMLDRATKVISAHFDKVAAPLVQPAGAPAPRGLLNSLKRNMG
jgi:hypothetical protein